MFKLSEKFINALLTRIYNGEFTRYNLPYNLYSQITDHLKAGLYKGYGTDISSLIKRLNKGTGTAFWELKDLDLLAQMRTNVHMFSAAKTYQQVREISGLITDSKGVVRPLGSFLKDARGVFDTYNKTWLTTEYDTAIGQAQNAAKWRDIEKQADVLPVLEYDAVLDKNTSDICRPLDGLQASVNDPVWKKIMPLNHFNCRCMVKQLSAEEAKLTGPKDKEKRYNEAMNNMQDLFKMNVGTDGVVFKKDHPYFVVPKTDKKFAQQNFGLKIPIKD